MSKFFALLLAGAFIIGNAPLLSASAKPFEATAGCHGHSQPKPASQPVSYQCCAVGHSPALQPTVSSAPLLLLAEMCITQPLLVSSPKKLVVRFNEIPASPRLLTPLRI